MRKRNVICVVVNSKGSDGKEMALPDSECEGQERPSEREPCPHLPPCVILTTSSPILLEFTTSSSLSTSALPQAEDFDEDSEEDEDLNSSIGMDSDDSLQEDDVILNSITTDRSKVLEFSHNRNGTGGGRHVNGDGWAVMQWGRCSVTCGTGVRTRRVVCMKPDSKCNLNKRPSVSEYCHMQQSCNLLLTSGELSPLMQ